MFISLSLSLSATMVKRYRGKPVIAFYSNAKAPHHQLSNFHHAPFRLKTKHVPDSLFKRFPSWKEYLGKDGCVFRSSEHAWHSLKAKNRRTFLKFCVGGDFDELSVSFFKKILPHRPLVDRDLRAQHKITHWGKKKNVGIVPKLAVSKKNMRKLNLSSADIVYPKDVPGELMGESLERAFWKAILKQKFRRNKEARAALMSTGDAYLLEFSRDAKRRSLKTPDRPARWSGMIEDGILYGGNYMGVVLSEVRDGLKDA